MKERTLRWGILGCAGIAKGSVIPGIQKSKTGEVVAIASRDLAKAQETAQALGIKTAYGSYEELLADESIEAVYIPLPNHLHRVWTIRAAEAGKHVLCEKPIALNTAEAQEMVDACAKANVQLAEAFMYRHHPRYERIKEIIQSGKIGEIRGLHSTFSFNNAGDTNNVRYKQHMGGGSIYDVGCYPISVARLIIGAEPIAATAQAFFSPAHDDVDMMVSGLIEFPNSIGLTFDCSMWAAFRNTLEILGTEGRIEVPSAFVGNADASDHFYVETREGRREEEVPHVNQYALQADAFAQSVFNDIPSQFSSTDAVLNMRVIDACLQSARENTRIIVSKEE